MSLKILVIVEYGAQKQRVFLDANSSYSYRDICDHIYTLFKLDASKTKYILQKQDSFKTNQFKNIDEQSFINELKQYATKNIKNTAIRLRLIPAITKDWVNIIEDYEFSFSYALLFLSTNL